MITSERHEKSFLGGTERFIGTQTKEDPEFLKQVPAILHAYYEHDLISEEVVTKWGSRASKKYTDIATSKKVRKAAESFLVWLANADSESEDDSE